MDILSLLVALATIIAGVIAAIQILEWWQKRIQITKQKRAWSHSSSALNITDKPLRIINFTHPLTKKTLKQIEQLTKRHIDEVIEIKTQLDEYDTFDSQIDELIDKIGLTSEQWQEGQFLIHIPGFAQAAATVIAKLHGRMGHFPTIVRLRTVRNKNPREFELAEILNLQNIRDDSRNIR